MVVSLLFILKYDGSSKSRSHRRENGQKKAAFLDKDDVWKTCYKAIHPNWLLAYRLIAFSLLLSLLTADLGSSLSIRGCLQSCKGDSGASTDGVDTERGTYIAPVPENASVLIVSNGLNSHGEPHDYCCLALQIVFQLAVCMHSVNAICLLGDVCLNRLRFPFFRIAYFVLWTCVFVIFQWILHIFVSLRWPYPFLDLSSQYAPLWYFAVGILHLPCYGMFAILIRIKTYLDEFRVLEVWGNLVTISSVCAALAGVWSLWQGHYSGMIAVGAGHLHETIDRPRLEDQRSSLRFQG
ncbi:uncharacterized protein [Solanum tuberosum]|uniref:uncharacterized protein n=1 Tax=Solanum tuberosum TaxID=4113 RepID=UPI00073A33BB|nr:PREDICTED: uncharacterized protein LOC107058696 [Solanum tuberosum]